MVEGHDVSLEGVRQREFRTWLCETAGLRGRELERQDAGGLNIAGVAFADFTIDKKEEH